MIKSPTRPPGTVRLVATDVDGTVLGTAAPWISERTVRAIRLAEAAGVAVILITGRRPETLRPLARALGLSGPAICCNGALICDLDSMAVLTDERIPAATAAALVHDIRAAVPGVCFAWSAGLSGGCDAAYLASATSQTRLIVADDRPDPRAFLFEVVDEIEHHLDGGITRMLAKQPRWPNADVVAAVTAAAGERAMVTTSGAPFADVQAAGVSKAVALERLCAESGIERADVVAIGDGPNDIEMLLWAGRGIAMGNAHPTVLEAVSERTDSNSDDGFAAALELLLTG